MVKKVAQRAIAAGLAGMMSFGAVAPAAMALDDRSQTWWWYENVSDDEGLTYFKRIAGDTRYDTMKKIVEATYKVASNTYWHATTAVVASGDNFPDALAANGLAGALNNGEGAPLILTKKGALSSQAKTLLQNMQVQTVYIMGGTSAVSQEVEDAIRDLKIATIRVAGADRQATSAEAFRLMDGNWYKKYNNHSVIIATGANYADALSIAPFAYATGTPIILTKADGTLTDDQVKYIKDNDEIWRVIIVGGTDVVNDSVITAVGTYNGSRNTYNGRNYITYRISGADRYDTSAKVADWEVNEADAWLTDWDASEYAGFSFAWTFIATGENFPDALAGGQLAGGKWYAKNTANSMVLKPCSPILLTKEGNRSADSVISANLAWNPKVYDNAAYALYVNWTEWLGGFNPFTDYTTYSQTVYNFIDQYLINGFFTAGAIGGQTAIGEIGNAELFDLFVYDGYVERDSNFSGIIFGGTAAVSKKTAERLDDTVAASIGGTNRLYNTNNFWKRYRNSNNRVVLTDSTTGAAVVTDKNTILNYLAGTYYYATNAPYSTDGAYLTNYYSPTNITVESSFTTNSTLQWETIRVDFDHFSFDYDPITTYWTWHYSDSDLSLRFNVHYDSNGAIDGLAPVFFKD